MVGHYLIADIQICYTLFGLPSNLIIRRVGPRYWLSFLTISWGCCHLGIGFVQNWEGILVCRVLLGVFQAGGKLRSFSNHNILTNSIEVFPGAIFIIGSWYRQFEMARKVSLFYTASLIASGVVPILSYALSSIANATGNGWRWIFYIQGGVTIILGIFSLRFLIECKYLREVMPSYAPYT